MSEVLVAQTFLRSANGLDGRERARALDFLAKFYEDPSSTGRNFEPIRGAKSGGLSSARITRGLRAVVHRDGDRYTLLYAGQHDEAYEWAGRRRVEVHPTTGALQIVEAAEEAGEEIRHESAQRQEGPRLFPEDRFDEAYLLSLGIPEDWLPVIRMIGDDDQLLRVAAKLPEEVGERLLALAEGELVTPPSPARAPTPTRNPDTLRRFWVVGEAAELADLLNKPLEDWTRFLHPSQRAIVEGAFNGPVKVTGSAGTGKTVVAMHRARHLARQGRRVLLTTFVTTLCQNLERNLRVLCTPAELEKIDVSTVHSRALNRVRQIDPEAYPVKDDTVRELLAKHAMQAGAEVTPEFLQAEWDNVIQLQGIGSWDEYRDAERRGRGSPLNVRERRHLWKVFAHVRETLEARSAFTWSDLCRRGTALLESGGVSSPYEAAVVDEVQDLKPPEIRFLAGLAGKRPDGLMLCGDAGQRIYPGGFSLRKLGIEVRGRSHVLRINYRTTEQIRRFADGLRGDSADDMDGGAEPSRGTRSLLRGPEPACHGYASADEEARGAVASVQRLLDEGLSPGEMALFARTARLLDPMRERLEAAGIPHLDLARSSGREEGGVRLGTMHRAKGLEFKAVLLLGCSDGMVPLRSVVERATDPADREAALTRERQLLYVSLTRARDEAILSWVGEPSPFLADVLSGETRA